jgi:hypothetical protein
MERQGQRRRLRDVAFEWARRPDPNKPDQLHDVVKLTARGDYFHVGATPLYVRVGEMRLVPAAISPDQTQLVAYLPVLPPDGAPVLVEQGDQVLEAPRPFRARDVTGKPPSGPGVG